MSYRIVRVLFAIVVVFASLPLSLFAQRHGFGLAASLTVPTSCLGFWFAVVSPCQAQRIGWFAFSSVAVALLPMGPWWKRIIEAVLNWVQDIIRGSQPTLLYSLVETVAVLALIVLPWVVGCVLGWFAAKLVRRFLYSSDDGDESGSLPSYQFTLRGMLCAIMVFAVLTGWLSNTVRQWHEREQSNQGLILQRFKDSFSTGKVVLLAEPLIVEDQDHTILKRSQNQSGISEYRIIAPVNKDGRELWAVWTYLCDDNYPGHVNKFGYAEAGTQNGLPPHPFPMTQYLHDPKHILVDGEPVFATNASLLEAPTNAKSGGTMTIVAKTDRGMECDLVIRPFQAVVLPPVRIVAPETGIVRWTITIDPAYLGTHIDYEFQSRTNMLYRAKVLRGTVKLIKIGDEIE